MLVQRAGRRIDSLSLARLQAAHLNARKNFGGGHNVSNLRSGARGHPY